MCVLSNERYKTYQTGFSFWGRTLGAWGVKGVRKNLKHDHVAYQIEGDDEQNRMQVKNS